MEMMDMDSQNNIIKGRRRAIKVGGNAGQFQPPMPQANGALNLQS